MRRILVLLPTAFLIAAAPPADQTVSGKGCISHGIDLAGAQPDAGGFRRLDQLPPANEILTVIHSVDGCQKPVIVRYDIGGNPSLAK
ncbi:hypothetical protein [Sphingomonas oryzagri]